MTIGGDQGERRGGGKVKLNVEQRRMEVWLGTYELWMVVVVVMVMVMVVMMKSVGLSRMRCGGRAGATVGPSFQGTNKESAMDAHDALLFPASSLFAFKPQLQLHHDILHFSFLISIFHLPSCPLRSIPRTNCTRCHAPELNCACIHDT